MPNRAADLLRELKELRSKLEAGAFARATHRLSPENTDLFDERMDSFIRKRDEAIFFLLEQIAEE